jgi:hypothetical protein
MPTGAAHQGLIRRAFRVVSPTCEDMTELISAMQDRQLPQWTRWRMRFHFLYCRYCRRVKRQLKFLRSASALLDMSDPAALEENLDLTDKENLRRFLKRHP